MKFPQPYTAIEEPPPSKSTIYKINNTSDYNPPAISSPPSYLNSVYSMLFCYPQNVW